MYITKEEILNQTNGGLDVIIRLYPEAEQCQDQRKKFKLRSNEKTASSKLFKNKDGVWFVKDFGGGKGVNAFQCVMLEKQLDFPEACQWIAAEFALIGSDGKKAKLVEFESRPAVEGEHDGLMTFSRKESFSETEIKTMFADALIQWLEKSEAQKKKPEDPYKKAKETLKRYGWSALESYTNTIKGKTYTYKASDKFPIFLMEDGEFCKLYKPREPEKQYRFLYYPVGKLPKDHVWGLKQAKEAHSKITKEFMEWESSEKSKDEKKPADKLECILIISGERDAMNAALMDYYPVWQNSETKGISKALIKSLESMAKMVVNVPDIDDTGIRMGIQGANENINLATAWLPWELLSFRDQRGNPSKDLRDFLSVKDEKGLVKWRKKDFDRLIKTAKKCQFWYKIYTDKGEEWQLDQVNILYYLWCSGFRKLKNEGFKDGFQFVHISGHVVREVDAKTIRNHVRFFLQQHYQDNKLMNKFLRSTVLNDGQLEYLEDIEIDFTDYTPDSQIFFFTNEAWRIKAEAIEKIRHQDIAKEGLKVWEQSIVSKRVELLPPMFEQLTDDEGEIMVRPLNQDCPFMKYLVATCRVHWRKEEEALSETGISDEVKAKYWSDTAFQLDGPAVFNYLTVDEANEQMKHLANKLFVLGYLLHRYKNPSRAWGVYAMDAKLSDEGQSWGRSGKSVFFKVIRKIINTKTISGRNTDITRNAYLYDGVTEYTKLLLIDDCNEFLKYDTFFTPLTDSLQVNPKFVREFELPFDKSPKFGFTSNYALKNPDPSTEARLIYIVFSDFFHEKTADNDYQETRSPKDWIGKNLMDHDYTDKEWNSFLNLCAQAIQFYLSVPRKLTPPMASVNLRQLKSTMGDAFYDWAIGYFSPESGNLNKDLPRSEVYDDCMNSCKFKLFTGKEFTKRIKAFVKYQNTTVGNYTFNPIDKCNSSSGRIIKKHSITGKSEEFIHIAAVIDPLQKTKVDHEKSFADECFENTPEI